MHKRFLYAAILVSLIGVLTVGCGAAPTATPQAAKAAVPTAAAAFPMTITDAGGRQVTLKAKPQRVVSLSPANTEVLFAIGAGDQVVADTEWCNYPAKAATLPKIGGYTPDTMSTEKIVAAKPDLVVADTMVHAPVIKALEQVGITVIGVNANSFSDAYNNMQTLGNLTGHGVEAAAAVAKMQERIKAVTDKVAKVPAKDRLSVFWEVWDEPLMTAGPNTFAGQIVDMAGGKNVFSDVKQDYPTVSAEQIVTTAPAVIMGPDTHGDKLTVDQIAKRPGWEKLPAVKNSRVYLINGDMSSRAGPRLADALEAAASALYPNQFK